jgi:hypothetical protein
MPRDFTLDDYKAALKGPGNKRGKAGWKYLVARGVAESDIFYAARGIVFPDSEVSKYQKALQKIQVKPAQVRALGKQLRKHSQLLRKVLNQYPELVPARAENLLLNRGPTEENQTRRFELSKRIRLAEQDIPVLLEAVGTRLTECRGKKPQGGNATVRRRRPGQGPDIHARILLHLFWDAGARLCDTDSAPFEWAAELLNLACRLAGCLETFSADGLRKMEKSLQNYLLRR